jgi:hypothetical protein
MLVQCIYMHVQMPDDRYSEREKDEEWEDFRDDDVVMMMR